MISYTINIGDLLNIKINANKENFIDIFSRFVNIKKDNNNFEYEIIYHNFVAIKEIKFGMLVKPFRNAEYIVSKGKNKIIAYSPSQKYSCENIIIREKNKINIFCHEDYSSKILVRVITELIIRKLLEKNYFPLHASCVMKDNEAILFLGGKNSGKSVALATQVILNEAYPISNDITFVGKENNKWYAFGLPYDITFDSNFFSNLEMIIKKCQKEVNRGKYNSNKIRFNVLDFIKTFNTKWIWYAPLSSINVVSLNKDKFFSKISNLSFNDSLLYLSKYGKDDNFCFDDYLGINDLYPKFEYENLSRDVIFNKLDGNMLEYYLRRK